VPDQVTDPPTCSTCPFLANPTITEVPDRVRDWLRPTVRPVPEIVSHNLELALENQLLRQRLASPVESLELAAARRQIDQLEHTILLHQQRAAEYARALAAARRAHGKAC
jgi:hypothetical protein